MRITYSEDSQIYYFYLLEPQKVNYTYSTRSTNLNVDLNDDMKIVGIEFMSGNNHIRNSIEQKSIKVISSVEAEVTRIVFADVKNYYTEDQLDSEEVFFLSTLLDDDFNTIEVRIDNKFLEKKKYYIDYNVASI